MHGPYHHFVQHHFNSLATDNRGDDTKQLFMTDKCYSDRDLGCGLGLAILADAEADTQWPLSLAQQDSYQSELWQCLLWSLS